MPKFTVSEHILTKHLQDGGKLCDEIVANVNLLRMGVLKDDELTENERTVYTKVSSDLDQIKILLKNIKGNHKRAECPYNIKIYTSNGYVFRRFDNYSAVPNLIINDGHFHMISITKEDFVWEIGIKQDGNFVNLQDKVNITGYYHRYTNGSIDQIHEALESTIKFFPQPQAHRYEMRYLIENLRTFSKLIERISGFKLEGGYLGLELDKEDFGITFASPDCALTGTVKVITELERICPEAKVAELFNEKEEVIGIRFFLSEIPKILTAAQKNNLLNKSSITTNSIWQHATNTEQCNTKSEVPNKDRENIINYNT